MLPVLAVRIATPPRAASGTASVTANKTVSCTAAVNFAGIATLTNEMCDPILFAANVLKPVRTSHIAVTSQLERVLIGRGGYCTRMSRAGCTFGNRPCASASLKEVDAYGSR